MHSQIWIWPGGEIQHKMTAGIDAVRGSPWLARAKPSGEPTHLKRGDGDEVRTGHLPKLVEDLSVRNCRTAALRKLPSKLVPARLGLTHPE
jgi:hypothetical protein